MVLFKKKDIEESKLEIAKESLEQMKPTMTMEAGNTEVKKVDEAKGSTEAEAVRFKNFEKHDPDEMIESYSQNYGGVFSPRDFVKEGETVTGEEVFYAEVCKLLFAVQNEMKELKKEVRALKQ